MNERIPTPEELEEMTEAFNEWLSLHTDHNRTPREMFYHGYYCAVARWRADVNDR